MTRFKFEIYHYIALPVAPFESVCWGNQHKHWTTVMKMKMLGRTSDVTLYDHIWNFSDKEIKMPYIH